MSHFRSDHLTENLGQKAVRGGAFSGAGHAGQFLLMAASTVVLARLLTPEDYGLVAMVTAVTNVVAGFKDFGLAASTVQSPEITHRQTSALFWVNVASSIVLAIVVAAAAPWLALAYDEPRVRWLTVAMAATFVVSGLATQHHSLLRRQLRFGDVASIEFAATLTGVAVAIVAAYYGAAYWSLVLLYAFTQLGITAGVWIRCSWRPGRPERAAGIGGLLAYGGYLTGFKFLNSLLRSVDRILIGRTASAGPLGLYSRASYLVFIPIDRLSLASTAVALPVLSRLPDDPDRYRAFVLTATLLFGSVAIPFGCFAFAAADSTVLAVLGAQWTGGVPILRALAPMAMFATLETAATWVSLSTGNTQRQFAVGLALVAGSALAMLAGLQWGVIGVAIGLSSAYSVVWAAGLHYCLRPSPVRTSQVLVVLWRPAVAALTAAAVTFAAGRVDLGTSSAMVMLLRDLIAFSATYALFWMLLPGGAARMREMRTLARTLRARSPQ